MLKQTVTYTDFNGNEQTEDFYFNFTRLELIEMESSTEDGKTLSETLLAMVDEKDMMKIALTMKDILIAAYGEKSEDGKRFIKTPEIKQAFAESPAFDELYFEIATNADKAADFINGVIPQNLMDNMTEEQKKLISDKKAELTDKLSE